MLTAFVLSIVARFAIEFPQLSVILLFLTTAIIMGLRQGITSLVPARLLPFRP